MRTIFLLDIDCFFASVEMALHPELRGRPLCVGGRRGERGIVVCPNYEARSYGVKTAMPIRTAERLLPPGAVFMRGNHKLYGEFSDRVMDLLYTFSPDIEQVSIDEAYLDVTGCLHLWGNDPVRMATAIQDCIHRECTFSVSIGVASTKVCAKIAAGIHKPGGLVVVPAGGEQEFLAPLPIEVLPGVGVKTAPRLHVMGIFTVADVLRYRLHQQESCVRWLGRRLAMAVQGEDATVVHGDRVERSISRDTTFGHDTDDMDLMTATLYALSERCGKALRRRSQIAATVTAKVRFGNFITVQRQTALPSPTAYEEEIYAAARRMAVGVMPPRCRVRMIGVKVSHLRPAGGRQLELDGTQSDKRERLHARLDALQEKFGHQTIQWGIMSMLRRTA